MVSIVVSLILDFLWSILDLTCLFIYSLGAVSFRSSLEGQWDTAIANPIRLGLLRLTNWLWVKRDD